jgi:hypothetical protein
VNKNIASFNADRQEDLRRLESTLAALNKRQELRFGHLQGKRVTVLADLYAKLTEAYKATTTLTFYVSPRGGGGPENASGSCARAMIAWSEADRFLTANKLYLSRELSSRLQYVTDLYEQAVGTQSIYELVPESRGVTGPRAVESAKKWETTCGKVKEILGDIETEFRILLGSQSETRDAPVESD